MAELVRDTHKAWLSFLRKAVDVPLGYSADDLREFRTIAMSEAPFMVPLIEDYVTIAHRSESSVERRRSSAKKLRSSHSGQMHLFDLLREKKFFPQNLDLARFAERVLPHMRSYRFDKMSRTDIAGRIMEHIESRDARTREKLEESMREALSAMSSRPPKETERRSFLSRWERIIKGIEL